MRKLKKLDIVLGEALEQVNDAARLLRECKELETDENFQRIGHSINNLWEIREIIYKLKPSLKQDFVSELEGNKRRYGELSSLSGEAHDLEEKGSFDQAIKVYEQLLKKDDS